MGMETQIIEWDVRGLLKNLDDVQERLQKLTPKVLCLQEIHLNSKYNLLHQYITFREDSEGALASFGSAAIIHEKTVECQQ